MTEQHLTQNAQCSSRQDADEFVNQILTHCVRYNLAVEYDDGVYLKENHGIEVDNLKTIMSMIDAKLVHYRAEKRKAKTRVGKILRERNIRVLLQRLVGKGLLQKIPPVVLSSILEQSAREDRSVNSLLDRVRMICSQSQSQKKKLNFDISDDDQTISE